MLKFIAVLLLGSSALFLEGCEPYDPNDYNYGLGWGYDFTTPAGIQYRLEHGTSTFEADQLDTIVHDMGECLGLPLMWDNNQISIIVVSPETMTRLVNTYRSTRANTIPNSLYLHENNYIILLGGIAPLDDDRLYREMVHQTAHYLLDFWKHNADYGHSNLEAQACVPDYR